jgi:hypothetical protein
MARLLRHGCSQLRLAAAPLLGEPPHIVELTDSRPGSALGVNRCRPGHPCP